MSALAPTLEAFFSDRLARERQASPHTVAAYRDTFRLLLTFVHRRTGVTPSKLSFADLDAASVGAFLEHLEAARGNSARTRNARLAAIHAFFRYASFRHPEHAGLTCGDVHLGAGAHVRCVGKGRKERVTPLTRPTVAVLRVWLAERDGRPGDPLFAGRADGRLSSDAVQRLVGKYVAVAARRCPSLRGRRITPHVLRHTSAMALLRGGVDTAVIALWLGHERVQTTQIYLHADLSLKERALARTAPPRTRPGRYRPPDALLAFLEDL